MENLIIEETTTTPAVNFNSETGELTISGKSIHENPYDLYESLIAWVENYSTSPGQLTTFKVDLVYFNTSSSKCLLNLLKKISKLKENGNDLAVKWYYDTGDDDAEDTGKDFSRLLKIPFEFIEKA